MAEDDYVDGQGIISDESDFYGSQLTKKKLEKQARRPRKRSASSVAPTFPKKLKQESTPALKTGAQCGTKSENALAFLKSRPQLARMKPSSQATEASQSPVKAEESAPSNEAAELVSDRRFEGHQGAWQQNESVVEFLRRLPVSDPATASIGPWLWVGNPKYPSHWKLRDEKGDLKSFRDAGETLLSDFDDQRERINEENPGKAQATITRKMNPHRNALEKDMLAKAQRYHITSGKWMLFPGTEDLPRIWRVVAEATAAGRLGPMSKVGTWEPGNDRKGTLICVYTYDFNDYDDVKRVLSELLELGGFQRSGRSIYYKCDAYTYLDIGSNNAYGLKASMYASDKVLEDSSGVKKSGGTVEMKNGTMDSFLAKEKWEF